MRFLRFRKSKKISRSIFGLFFGLILAALVLAVPHSAGKRSEDFFYDAYSRQVSSRTNERSNDIVIVDIDENALEKYGSYNEWNRGTHAKVIRALEDGGAAAIAFDILFKNADFGTRKAKRAKAILDSLYPQGKWSGEYSRLRSAFDDDSSLVRAVAEAKNVIVCGTFNERKAYRHESQWLPLSTRDRAKEVNAKPTFSLRQADHPEAIEPKDLLDNVFPELSRSATAFGVVNIVPDEDGVLRSLRMLYRFPNPGLWPKDTARIYPSLSLATLIHLFGTDPDSVRIETGRYIDMGKTFGVFRDSLGILRTTYPQFTYPMLREILRHAPLLSKNVPEDSVGAFFELSSQVLALKDEKGNVTIRTAEGDFAIGDGELSAYDRETVRYFQREIDSLPAGSERRLSADMDFHFNPVERRWIPNYAILTKDVLRDLYATDERALEALGPGEGIRFGDRKRIPIEGNGDFRLRFRSAFNIPRAERTFQHISYYDVAEGRLDPATYQGKIFILGSATPALFDFTSAPHEENFPAVLIHATALDDILTDSYIRLADPEIRFGIFIGVAVIATAIGLFVPQSLTIILLLILFVLVVAVSFLCFQAGIFIGAATHIASALAAFLGSFLTRFYFETKDKRFLDNAFKQYISPSLIDEMLSHEVLPVLGGSKTNLTAFFSDIQEFSSFSEKIGDPSRLVELLNEYLSAMTDILLKNKGTLDKYEGDAMIAFFGAPLPLENHQECALRTALEIQSAQRELRQKWKESGNWPEEVLRMHTRIGLNTGNIVVGNMGSKLRKNYTMMGDAVNLASRLESAGKQYGVYIFLSEEVLAGVDRERFIVRPIDLLRVVGKTEPVQTYELLGMGSDENAGQFGLLVALWKKAMGFYRAQKWDAAIAAFRESLLLEPHLQSRDPGAKKTPSEVYINRCESYKLNPPVRPGESWDGVYVADSK